MSRFFNVAKLNSDLAGQDANALIALYGGFLAYEEARRRCRDPKYTFEREAGHWERVTNVLARRTGRTRVGRENAVEVRHPVWAL